MPKEPTAAFVAQPASDATLWTVKQVAMFLRRSPRWVWTMLKKRNEEAGSIPHVRLPGKCRSPRFVPENIKAWAAQGFPSVTDFTEWKKAAAKHRYQS